MKYTLSNAQLAEMVQNLRCYSEHHAHTFAFRNRCAETADLITRHLDGEDVEGECEASIEEVYGPLAQAEIARMKAFNALDDQLVQAALDDDPKAWAAAMAQALPLMSESQVLGVMDALHDGPEPTDLPGIPATTHIHAIPRSLQ